MHEEMVAIADLGSHQYPAAPFSPDTHYPEYDFKDVNPTANRVYAGVRQLFLSLELDRARYGSPHWNPLGGLIEPGMRVLVKPNLVRHYHPYGMDPASLVTHASLIRAVCDYVLIAAGRQAELVIADAPLQSCVFKEVLKLSGINRLIEYYRAQGVRAQVRDLRLVRALVERRFPFGRVLVQQENCGDPLGYTTIDLNAHSLHAGRDPDGTRFRVTCYDPIHMRQHHGGGRHQYIIANTLLDADVVINLPKMKTHHKAGITGALKNFIGINGHKDCLPHHTKGTPEEGGDEYLEHTWIKRLDSWMLDAKETHGGVLVMKAAAVAHRLLHQAHMDGPESYWEGSWYGNETISRTTLDLNRIARYADRGGRLCARPQRSVFTVVDGVLAGEKDGPLAPTPKPVGLLLAGMNSLAVDTVMARLMGFRHDAIPTIRDGFLLSGEMPLAGFPASAVTTVSESSRWHGLSANGAGPSLGFEPHKGWKGYIQL